MTRTFKRKGQSTSRSLTLSLSFKSVREAKAVARALDMLKAHAAIMGHTFSTRLAAVLIGAAAHEHDTSRHGCWCKPKRVRP